LKQPIRYSLLNLLLVTAIVALSIALYLSRSRLAEVEAEADRVRNLFGELSVTDRFAVHAISIPTGEAMNWRWRVYLPAGHDFGVYAYKGQFDAAGLPLSGSLAVKNRIGGQTNPREPREIILDVVLGDTIEGEPCLWISENGRAGAPVAFGSSLPSWANGSMMLGENVAGERNTVSTAVKVPLGLISLRGMDAAGATSDDAVLVWIGQYEKSPTQSLRDRGILP